MVVFVNSLPFVQSKKTEKIASMDDIRVFFFFNVFQFWPQS